MSQSILIPVAASESIIKRMSRLASQCGVALETVSGTTIAYRRDTDGKVDTTRAVECSRLTVGDMPRINGYTLIGKLIHTEAGNIIAIAPEAQGEATPAEWRACEPTCDHCNTIRRRTETFLVRCPDGAVKRVGRNCLADFLACDPAGFLARDAFDDVYRAISDEWLEPSGFGGHFATTTLHYIACAVSAVQANGFIKRGSEMQCTADTASFLSGPCPCGSKSGQTWKDGQPTADHTTRAEQAIKWAAESTETSDYAHNLRVAVASTVVNSRFSGILASLPQAFNRHLGQIAEQAARAAAPDAGHLGEIGKRIGVAVTIMRVKAFESDYGSKLLIAMRSDAGHELITFTTGRGCSANDVGKRFEIRGTVKRHTEYQGRAQTELSRVKF
jgi:hypothetical protein